jgi:predicted alpha/beta superfamily hydrolase
MRIFCLGFVLILLYVVNVQAKESFAEMTIAGSQVRILQSKIVNQEYQLLIKTPAGYEQSDKTYPVIYFLDAQWDFPLMISAYGQSYFDGFIPEAILVGIQWGGDNPDPNVLRARDFTPSNMTEVPNSGGAAKFLQFIKQELIPFVGNEYRSNNNRVLMGSSYGGLFTLYALFNEPNLFHGYIPTSSASAWDANHLYSYSKAFAEKKLNHSIRLYSAIGEFDDLTPAFDALSEFFEEQSFKGLSFKFERLAGLGHASLKSAGNTWGLHYVFTKPKLALSNQQLLEFTGQYKGNTSKSLVDVLIDNGQLYIQIGGKKHPLFANTQLHFYQEGAFFNASFDPVVKPQEMSIENFFGVQSFSRMEKQQSESD